MLVGNDGMQLVGHNTQICFDMFSLLFKFLNRLKLKRLGEWVSKTTFRFVKKKKETPGFNVNVYTTSIYRNSSDWECKFLAICMVAG